MTTKDSTRWRHGNNSFDGHYSNCGWIKEHDAVVAHGQIHESDLFTFHVESSFSSTDPSSCCLRYAYFIRRERCYRVWHHQFLGSRFLVRGRWLLTRKDVNQDGAQVGTLFLMSTRFWQNNSVNRHVKLKVQARCVCEFFARIQHSLTDVTLFFFKATHVLLAVCSVSSSFLYKVTLSLSSHIYPINPRFLLEAWTRPFD